MYQFLEELCPYCRTVAGPSGSCMGCGQVFGGPAYAIRTATMMAHVEATYPAMLPLMRQHIGPYPHGPCWQGLVADLGKLDSPDATTLFAFIAPIVLRCYGLG
jgi:hypothetical protein